MDWTGLDWYFVLCPAVKGGGGHKGALPLVATFDSEPLDDWLTDRIMFYAVLTIFHSYDGGHLDECTLYMFVTLVDGGFVSDKTTPSVWFDRLTIKI